MKRDFLPYRPRLTRVARMLRNNMTLSEILLWNKLKQKQMMGYDFHRQKPIDEYVVDFFCPKLSLVVEIDGESHEGKLAKDSERQQQIERYGVHFLRFPDDEVKANLDGVAEEIRKWIEESERQRGTRRPIKRG
jgi:very-short-patch-repair endonuclease